MRKTILALLLAFSATFAFAAIGCDKNKDETPNQNVNDNTDNTDDENEDENVAKYDVTFAAGEGYTVVGDDVTYDQANNCYKANVKENNTLTFSIDLGAFYAGTPIVTVNNTVLADTDGVYSLTVTGNTEVSITGITKAQSAMAGTGAFDDAYVVEHPIDLVHIAEQVNAGNRKYATAYYVLKNDIDFKGETIQPIGTAENPFSGCFTCLTNPETGAMERGVISNFKINTDDKNYVGLFGCVQVDMSVTSSGLFYGIRIDNFEINAATTKLGIGNRNIYCGGLIGYGLGTRLYLCDATNGTINITADPSEFSFVGGMIGVQQSYYMAEYEQFFNAETAYATVDVDVSIVSGNTLYAGGIAGYLYTNSFACPAYIHNSYSTGNISGAIRTGGIAGGLGQYTSIATCYSSGNVTANVNLTAEVDGYSPEYCIAYAGGIVGFAENDTVINDCFAIGTTTAKANDGIPAQKTGHAIAGGDEDGKISAGARKYVVRDCLGSIDKTSMKDTLTKMGWHEYNWIFPEVGCPTINYSASDGNVTIKTTVEYVDKEGNSVSAKKRTYTNYSYTDMYAPIANAFVDGYLETRLTADDNKKLSFGYYFDKECTQPVPYSYISTRESTLYMGFTDPSEIVGEYTFAVKDADAKISLFLDKDGKAYYTDGDGVQETTYQYDGETLIIEGARLARYFQGKVDKNQSLNEDTLFDVNRYDSRAFQAVKTETGLDLFDGTYFTKDAPLKAYAPTAFEKIGAYYTNTNGVINEYVFLPDGTGTKDYRDFTYAYANGVITINGATQLNESSLLEYNVLKGTWNNSAFVGSVLSFDGINTWKQYRTVYKRVAGNISSTTENLISGTFTTSDGITYVLKDDNNNEYARVQFDEFGFLQITYANGDSEKFSTGNSLVGKWSGNDVELQLSGVNNEGVGEATATFTKLGITYNLTYTISETVVPSTYLCLYYEDTLFGYFTYDEYYNALQATLFDPASIDGGYITSTLYLVSSLENAWISNDETFDGITFSGTGHFDNNGNWIGNVNIGGTRTQYVLENGGLNGYFIYNGTRYALYYDYINNLITINTDVILERKDTLADTTFVSIDNANRISSFEFDGKGSLLIGGTMTATLAGAEPVEYTYKHVAGNEYVIFNGSDEIGSVNRNDTNACYDITLNGVSYTTYINNEYLGTWAMSGEFQDDVFIIGATDLNGDIHATFKNVPVLIKQIDVDYYYFDCVIDYMPMTYYVFALYSYNEAGDKGAFDSIAISEYNNLANSDYILCSRVDAMRGTWTQNNNPNFTLSFDGVQSSYTYGTATMSYKGYPTYYNYVLYKDSNGNVTSVMLWSQNTYAGDLLYYKLTPCETTKPGAFVLGDKAFERSEIDALYNTSAKGLDGYTYVFDGGNLNNDTWGSITATKGSSSFQLQYDIISFNTNNTVTLSVKGMDNKERLYILDRSNSDNIKIYDALYNVSAKLEDGYTYTFNGGNYTDNTWGTITAKKDNADNRTLQYNVVSISETEKQDTKETIKTAVLTVTETVNGETVTYTANVDYSDSKNVILTFEVVKAE